MSTAQLRREIKKAIDRLPPKQLASLADYVQFLACQPIEQRVAVAHMKTSRSIKLIHSSTQAQNDGRIRSSH